ncbi:hypothetical protein [Peptostreptococcus russellii]|uniref:hypothetical protein n=1 Tax=Peptostreptococcus russellii TaxID=215200 RepID=UPI002943E6CB|nr:hypothetical protein [Peptostreptococcus russellii]
MRIIVCILFSLIVSYYFSDNIKSESKYIYSLLGIVSILSIIYSNLSNFGYDVEYNKILGYLQSSIVSGALGGSIFIIVMYMGVFTNKTKFEKRLRKNRAELSIIATILTLPHNSYYLLNYLFNLKSIMQTRGLILWTCLMALVAACFAIIIMIPLFVTSFNKYKKKVGKSWKEIQEFAYIFYAMLFIQILMIYLSRPSSLSRNINLVFYSVLFGTYSILKIYAIREKKKLKISSTLEGI